MKIQANPSGSRNIEVSEQHLQTIEDYSLFENLVDSNGIIDEDVLDKLKFRIRAMLESDLEEKKELIELCLDVIYNKNMKAYGLEKLITMYIEWKKQKPKETDNDTTTETV